MGALDILSNIGSAIGLSSDDNNSPKMVKSTGFDGKSSVDMPEGALSMTDTKAPSGMADFIPMAGPKGGKTFIDPKSSEALLKNMQDFVDQRTGNQAQWMNNLANAQAWTIGDAGRQAEALKGRQELASTQAKDVQDMQMQIAQFRAAQERNKAYNDMLKGVVGTQEQTGGASQAGNAPQAGGAPQSGNAPQAGGIPQTVTTASGQRFAFSSLPPETQAVAKMQQNPEDFIKVISDWAAEHAKKAQELENNLTIESKKNEYAKGMEPLKFYNSPEAFKQMDWYNTATGQMEKHSAIEVRDQKLNNLSPTRAVPEAPTLSETESTPQTKSEFDLHKSYGTPAKLLDNLSGVESSHNPYAINPDTKALGRYQFTPETAAMLHKQGIKFNALDKDESRAAADFYIQQLVKQNGGDYSKAMAQYGGFKTKDPSKYVHQVLNGVDFGNKPAGSEVNVPQQAGATKSSQDKSFNEYTQEQEAQKALSQGEQTKTGQNYAAKHAAAIQAADNAPEDLANAKYIRNIITNNPKAFGVLQHPTVLAAIGTALSEGVNAPGTGYTHIASVDDAIRKAMPGSQNSDIVAAQKAAQKFSELQLNKAKVVLSGQGSVSNEERNLVHDMVGSIKNSPAALRDMLAWGEMRSNYDDVVGKAMKNWERKNPNASYRQFELTPEYETLKDNYKTQILTFADKAGNYVPPSAHQKLTPPPGYEAWKASQQPRNAR